MRTCLSAAPGLIAAFCLSVAAALPVHAADWSKQLPLQHHGRYFEFHYQRNSWDAAGFARFADGFIDLINREFIPVEFDYPIEVLVLPDRSTFHQFLRQQFAISDPPGFGIYFPAFKVFATYEDSGLGTFAHEIMHPLVERNLRDCPMWATEAIPAFFEKFIGYWQGDRLILQWGYQNPWRIEALGDNLPRLDLKRIVADKRPVTSFNNSDRRLVTVFLWQQGKLERFLRLIAARDRAGFRSYFEAAMEKPLKEIEPLWQAYLAEIVAHRAEVMRVPGSTVLPNLTVYQRAVAGSPPWRHTQAPRLAQ